MIPQVETLSSHTPTFVANGAVPHAGFGLGFERTSPTSPVSPTSAMRSRSPGRRAIRGIEAPDAIRERIAPCEAHGPFVVPRVTVPPEHKLTPPGYRTPGLCNALVHNLSFDLCCI